MEFLTGCQSQCISGSDADESAQNGCRFKLCSWSEEEVDGVDGSVSLDYGFLGRFAQAQQALPSKGQASVLGPLYDPGSLVPVRGLMQQRASGEAGSPLPRISENYVFDASPFGRGSYGEVIGATHRRTKARRAVKTVAKEGLKRYVKDVSGFVRREVDILRRLDHPNIVRLYEAYEEEDTIYLVLEICEGGDLLERVTVAKDRMPEHVASSLMRQMLSALQQLTLQGIVHRDLKPENFLFVRRDPETDPLPPLEAPVKLIDFGLSRRLSNEAGFRMTPKIGTTEYMAPEAFAGRLKTALADRADVWSIGVILHVIFIGHFPSPRLAELTTEEYLALPCWKHISARGKDMLGQMLRYDPNRRPTVNAALNHPWLVEASMVSPAADRVSRNLPGAVSAFANSVELRRVALAFAAREIDDHNLGVLREIYYHLEVACKGAFSRAGLERASGVLPGHLALVAAELLRNFDALDLDGSGTIDWTELLASVVGASFALKPSKGAGAICSDDRCWRAFDVMGGGGSVSGSSLTQVLGQANALEDRAATRTSAAATLRSPTGGTGGSLDVAGEHSSGGRPCHGGSPMWHRIVQEVGGSGSVPKTTFLRLMKQG